MDNKTAKKSLLQFILILFVLLMGFILLNKSLRGSRAEQGGSEDRVVQQPPKLPPPPPVPLPSSPPAVTIDAGSVINERQEKMNQKLLAQMTPTNKAKQIRAMVLKKSREQQQSFFSKTGIKIPVPENFRSVHQNVENQAELLFSFDLEKRTSFKVMTKNGRVNDVDKAYLEKEVLGFSLQEYQEIEGLDPKRDLNLNYAEVQVLRATRAGFMSYIIFIYDETSQKSIGISYDGDPGNVLSTITKMMDVVRQLKVEP